MGVGEELLNELRERPQIAFLTSADPRDRRAQSGLFFNMSAALQKHCGDVAILGPIDVLYRRYGRSLNAFSRLVTGKRYDYGHSIALAKRYAKVFDRTLQGIKVDLIFAPEASTQIAFAETALPIIYESDATFARMLGYYPSFTNLSASSMRQGNIIERKAIENASIALYHSRWAAQSAIDDYCADEARVHVIPVGANLDEPPSQKDVLDREKPDTYRLLFVGINWSRKGGEIAFDTMRELADMGLEVELAVCGCVPPKKFRDGRLKVIPFLDKNDAKQRRLLYNLYASSSFLLLPTRAETYGNVFCEASAFGLPSIATKTGGVPEVVRDGENGYTLPLSAGGGEYARLIRDIYTDEPRYYALKESSRQAYEERLNWDSWALGVKELIANM